MDLLLISDKDKSHTCISKILTDFYFKRQKTKIKNTFAKVVYSVLLVRCFKQS